MKNWGHYPTRGNFKISNTESEKKTTEDDEFEDWGDEEEPDDEKYWFTKDKIDNISSFIII